MDPSQESGLGPGDHTLSHNGVLVWHKKLPLTLGGTRISDLGYVVGLGSTEERVEEDGDFWMTRETHMLIIGPDGKIRADEVNEHLHQGHLLVESKRDRVLILTTDESEHEVKHWRTYKLSTGEFTGDWSTPYPFSVKEKGDLRNQVTLRIQEARSVPDTDLVLLHWWYTNYEDRAGPKGNTFAKDGGVYTLVNPSGETVWSLERRTAYTNPDSETKDDEFEATIRAHGAILGTSPGGQFSLWFPREQTKTVFSAVPSEDSWTVSSLPPESYSLPAPSPPEKSAPLAKINLRLIAKTHLGVTPIPRPVPAVRDIMKFGFQSNGNLQFIRWSAEAVMWVSLDAAGSVVTEASIPMVNEEGQPLKWLSCQGDMWYATTDKANVDKSHKLYRYDTSREILEPVGLDAGTRFPTIDRLIPTVSGGFVLLGSYRYSSTSTDVLMKCARDGTVLFNLSDYSLADQGLRYFIPSDFTITSQGVIAALSVVGKDIDILSSTGTFIRTIDLETAWGKEPHYPTHIGADSEGNFWVADDDQLWHMNPEGQLLATIAPRLPDGSKGLYDDFLVAPDGNLWKTDRRVLASFGADGKRGSILGDLPTEGFIQDPEYGQIDQHGRILISDAANGSWHVFDSDGTRLYGCKLPGEVDSDDQAQIGVDAEGRILIPTYYSDLEGYPSFRFSTTGEPDKRVELPSYRVMFVGNSGAYWADTYMNLELFDKDGHSLVSVRRRPDRDWWHFLWTWHVSNDGGTLAALDSGGLFLFDGMGGNGTQIVLPDSVGVSHVAASKDWIALWGWDKNVSLLNRHDMSIRGVVTPSNKNAWQWGFSPSGGELWGVDIYAQELYRYALPR